MVYVVVFRFTQHRERTCVRCLLLPLMCVVRESVGTSQPTADYADAL